MDHLDQHLATSALNSSLPASIRASATLGKRTLNKYYTMTDHSEVYWIAMGECFIYVLAVLIDPFCSLTPTSQTRILQDRQVGQRVDQER